MTYKFADLVVFISCLHERTVFSLFLHLLLAFPFTDAFLLIFLLEIAVYIFVTTS